METPRTPSALAQWYYSKHEEIRTNPVEVEKARLHKGLYNYFVSEIYPLVLYSRWRFPQKGVLCQPKIGSQGYDATIWSIEQPNKIHTVEVTWPQDGKDAKEVATVMNSHGFHGRVGDEFDRYNCDILERVLNASEKKSVRDYRSPGGSALLIVLDTQCSPLDESKRQAEIDALVQNIGMINFLVDSVYLIATPHEGIYCVIEQPTSG